MLALLSAMLPATLRAALEKERQLSENAHMNAQPRAKAHSQQCTTVRQLARQERILYVLRPSINDDEAIAVRALAMAGFTVGVYFIGRTHDMDMSHYRAFHNDTSGQGPAGERPYGDEWLPELAHVHFKARAAAANASEDVDELLHAVSEWRPALVLPDSQQAVTLLQKAAKAAVTAPAHSAAGASMAAAIACVRCSISPPQHHHRARSKLALMQYARSLSPPVPAPRGFVLTSSVAELAATLRAEMVKAGLPPNATVVLKSDSDGGGSGVKICGSASATALSLSDCLEAITKTRGRRGRMKIRMEVQEFLRGVTTSCVATALAGRVLSGYCVVKQLTAKRGIDCMMSVHHAAGKLNLQSTGASQRLTRTVPLHSPLRLHLRLCALFSLRGVGLVGCMVGCRRLGRHPHVQRPRRLRLARRDHRRHAAHRRRVGRLHRPPHERAPAHAHRLQPAHVLLRDAQPGGARPAHRAAARTLRGVGPARTAEPRPSPQRHTASHRHRGQVPTILVVGGRLRAQLAALP